MKSQPLISVIVPVFNVEDYLERSMDNLCGQTYPHLEIICVDDGSTDDSLAILRRYEAQDSRVVVISQPNRGVAAARNAALEVAKGEWITGLDPDDYIQKDAYATIIRESSDDVDMVVFGTKVQLESENELLHDEVAQALQRYFDQDLQIEGRQDLTPDSAANISVLVWNKLFRHSTLKASGLRFEEDLWNDSDFCFYRQWCAHARSAFFVHVHPHRHCLRSSSITYSTNKQTYIRRCQSHIRSMEHVVRHYQRLQMEDSCKQLIIDSIRNKACRILQYRASTPERNAWGNEFLAAAQRCGLDSDARFAPTVHALMEQFRGGRQAELYLQACEARGAKHPRPAAPESLHVALAVGEAQVLPAIISLQNIRENLGASSHVCAHVIGAQLSTHSQELIRQCATERLEVHLLTLDEEMEAAHLPVCTHHGAGYLQAALPALLPEAARCLWLEPGVLLSPQAAKLPLLDMGTAFIAAVPLPPGEQAEKLCQLLQERECWRRQKISHYFTSPLAVMNLAAMREEDAALTWLDACLMQEDEYPYPPQHALNLSLQDRLMALPEASSCRMDTPEPHAHATLPLPGSGAWAEWTRYYEQSPLSAFPQRGLACEQNLIHPETAPEPSTSPDKAPPRYGKVVFHYYRHRILACLTRGKRRERHIQKKLEFKNLRRKLRLERAQQSHTAR